MSDWSADVCSAYLGGARHAGNHREPGARRPAGQPGHAADLDWRGGRCVDDLRRDPAAPQARAGRLSHRASGWRPRCGPPPSHEATKETPMRKQALILGALLLLPLAANAADRSEENTSELQELMRTSSAAVC